MLAAAERQMDAGEVPWVRVEGGRCIVSERVMALLNLRSGQSVSGALWRQIIRLHLEQIDEELAAAVKANIERLESEVSRG